MAFALGTTTAFPALKYFCIYAAIGIILDFWFQISFFCAALVCTSAPCRLPQPAQKAQPLLAAALPHLLACTWCPEAHRRWIRWVREVRAASAVGAARDVLGETGD